LPICDKYRLKFEDDWIHDNVQTQNNNIFNMLDDNNIIHMESFNYKDSVGFNFTLEAFRDGKLIERTFANRLIWNKEKNCWTYEGYVIRLFNQLQKEFLVKGLKMDNTLKISPDEFIVKTNYVSSMTNPELNEYIRKETEKGNPKVGKYKVELYKRTIVPVSFFVLTLLAVAVSSSKSRGGTGFHLGIGIIVTFVYLLLIQIFNTMGNTGVMVPWVAVWIPTIVFFFVALFLLKRAPK